jgi:hypothetical protein
MQTFNKVYDRYDQAERAVRDIEAAGVPSADISVVANKYTADKHAKGEPTSTTVAGAETGAGIGAVVGGGVGLLAGLGMLAIPGLGPVVAVGWLATTALGAIAGSATGGIVGALVGAGMSEPDAHVYSEAVRRGGTLVTVRTSHALDQIEGLLNRHEPINPVVRRREYEASGWKAFDPMAPAYQPVNSATERQRRAVNS